jgi:hypothetical protein
MNWSFPALFFVLASLFSGASALAQESRNAPEPLPPFPPHTYPSIPLTDLPHPARSIRLGIAREDRVLKHGPLAPSLGDRAALAGFLRNQNTGLIRLLPREVYDSATYRTPKKLNIRGGGAYYSFAHLTHAYGYGSDIELDHDKLSVGFAGADYGMLTNIGDMPLEEITLDDELARDVAAYRPPRSEAEARQEFRRLRSEGLMFDGFLYRRTVPVKEHSTSLLRSINYNQSDVLVAFRLVRKDADGSVIIAWKLLKRYSDPQLKRNQK